VIDVAGFAAAVYQPAVAAVAALGPAQVLWTLAAALALARGAGSGRGATGLDARIRP
jgi:hypothetical protein